MLAMQMPMGGMCWMCILGGLIGIAVLVLLVVLTVKLLRKRSRFLHLVAARQLSSAAR